MGQTPKNIAGFFCIKRHPHDLTGPFVLLSFVLGPPTRSGARALLQLCRQPDPELQTALTAPVNPDDLTADDGCKTILQFGL